MQLPRLLCPATLVLALVPQLDAQVRASEAATLSQTIDGTVLTLEYSRPRARGRDSLFGKVVKWEEVWTPGANWATTLAVSKDIRLDGHPVAKGKYSVWLAVHRVGPWTMVLDPRHHRFHTQHPDSTVEQIRFDVAPGEGPFAEVLTWSFPEIRVTGGTLALQWGTARVAFRVDVTPSYNLTSTPARAGPYVGRYEFAWTQNEPGDTLPITLTITRRDSTLVGEWDPLPWPEAGPFILIPIREDWFIPGFTENGELYEVEKDMVIEFARTRGQGRATAFEVRGERDSLIATGRRKP
jgi:Protein of unknown function (DUF2911)